MSKSNAEVFHTITEAVSMLATPWSDVSVTVYSECTKAPVPTSHAGQL